MTRYVALLRGVNVGGAVLSMAALRATCESIGGENVATYIQSGNVVLDTQLGADGLRDRLVAALAEQLHRPATVMIRSGTQMAEILAANPFPAADPGALHVGFLTGPPDNGAGARLMAVGTPSEEVAIHGSELYLHLPSGLGRSKLAAAVIDPRQLGVACTVRNWRTLTRLVEMSREPAPQS